MKIREATESDLNVIQKWRHEAAEWLAKIGSDQWSETGLSEAYFRNRVLESIESGETWMAEDAAGNPMGTVALDHWSNAGLWTEQELNESLVIHRMMVDRSAAGLGVGSALLEFANKLASERGLSWLRLDAWTTNQKLHAYYIGKGFRHVRTVSGFVSGALFERPVTGH